MVEILSLLWLLHSIGNMARRRGRSRVVFGLMLLACWFGGELLGAATGLALWGVFGDRLRLLSIYGLALAGSVAGAGLAWVWAASRPPVNGVWHDLAAVRIRTSRLWGVLAGGLFGGVFGAVLTSFMYGGASFDSSVPIAAQGFLVVGFVGGLLGLVSGLQQEPTGVGSKSDAIRR
jgi:hypothetical protein